MRVLLQFFSTGFAIIDVVESDRTAARQNSEYRKQFSFIPNTSNAVKTPFRTLLDVRNGVHIRIIFNHLHGKSRAVMATLPPVH